MSTKRTTNEQVFSKIIEYVYAHMQHGAISIEAMADAVSLSTSQLNRRVKEVTGLTAGRFVTEIRISEAKRLLKDRHRFTVTDVAHHCGFADNTHLAHVFRRVVGQTPTQYAAEDDGESLHLFISAKLKSSSKTFRDNICPR